MAGKTGRHGKVYCSMTEKCREQLWIPNKRQGHYMYFTIFYSGNMMEEAHLLHTQPIKINGITTMLDCHAQTVANIQVRTGYGTLMTPSPLTLYDIVMFVNPQDHFCKPCYLSYFCCTRANHFPLFLSWLVSLSHWNMKYWEWFPLLQQKYPR